MRHPAFSFISLTPCTPILETENKNTQMSTEFGIVINEICRSIYGVMGEGEWLLQTQHIQRKPLWEEELKAERWSRRRSQPWKETETHTFSFQRNGKRPRQDWWIQEMKEAKVTKNKFIKVQGTRGLAWPWSDHVMLSSMMRNASFILNAVRSKLKLLSESVI